jgi:hypothetical protein
MWEPEPPATLRAYKACTGITLPYLEVGSGVMTYVPCFMKIGSGIEKLLGGDALLHRQDGDHIRLLLFST